MDRLDFVEQVRLLRYDCVDVIPREVIGSIDDGDGHKCRNGWFSNVYCLGSVGAAMGFTGERTAEMLDNFCKYLAFTGFSDRLTERVDIEKANMVLDCILDDCALAVAGV